jgi:hypothetical protein
MNSANGLDCQTYSRSTFDPQRLSGAVANPRALGIRAIDSVFGEPIAFSTKSGGQAGKSARSVQPNRSQNSGGAAPVVIAKMVIAIARTIPKINSSLCGLNSSLCG